jgi:transcription elongation GreA/GreB family factor
MSNFKSIALASALMQTRAMIASATEAKDQALSESNSNVDTAGDRYNVLRESALTLSEGHARRLSALHSIEAALLRLTAGMRDCDGTVNVTSLVKLVRDDHTRHSYLILTAGGGFRFEVGDHVVFTLSQEAPLAQELIGRHVGDEVQVRTGQLTTTYTIESVE